jgi:hypothetical protein
MSSLDAIIFSRVSTTESSRSGLSWFRMALMTSPTPPRRRWFQFSLGTMLVLVTVFAAWLGWELSFVRERKATRRWLVENEWRVLHPTYGGVEPSDFTIPKWRVWMGDEPIAIIISPEAVTVRDLERVRNLFREAITGRNPPSFRRRQNDRAKLKLARFSPVADPSTQ